MHERYETRRLLIIIHWSSTRSTITLALLLFYNLRTVTMEGLLCIRRSPSSMATLRQVLVYVFEKAESDAVAVIELRPS